MSDIITLRGHDLRSFLLSLGVDVDDSIVDCVRFDYRGDAIAVKVNAGMWSPNIGQAEGPY